MRRLLLALLTGLLATAAIAAPLASAVKTEIDSLLGRLEASGCEFNRNGTWYSAAEAKSHLLGKLKYLEERGLVQTTEQFIERAASGSSISGQPTWSGAASAARGDHIPGTGLLSLNSR